MGFIKKHWGWILIGVIALLYVGGAFNTTSASSSASGS
jgi:hypothetical protein